MNVDYQRSRSVEARSLALLSPFLDDLNGRWVLTDKGRLARHLQETCGDMLFNDRRGRLWGVECKAEEKWTRNFFLEVWSNRNLDDPQNHADHGSNPGWLLKTRADLLFYHFLDADALFVMNMFQLKRWAFVERSQKRGERASGLAPDRLVGRLFDFPCRCQQKYRQPNDTWAHCVPLSVLNAELKPSPQRFSVVQLRLELLDGVA